ncbi:MAG: IdeS/Mac family cysteine endopeptidase, partial [Akkermansia sp.]|nr:IdeS/Mac family cysteine endopeptidase [Akkermansia sp.]
MKLAHHLVLSLGLTLGLAFAEEGRSGVQPYSGIYVASGLTITETQDSGVTISGWYDAEKTPEDDIDDNMCYAASAANLIALWQNSSNAPSSEAPTTLDDIWNTFTENNLLSNTGGTPLSVVNWWLSGVYSPCEYIENTDPNAESSGTWSALPESDPMWDRFFSSRFLVDANGQPVPIPVTLPNLSK